MAKKIITIINLLISLALWLFIGRINSNVCNALYKNLPVYEVVGFSAGVMQFLFILGCFQAGTSFLLVSSALEQPTIKYIAKGTGITILVLSSLYTLAILLLLAITPLVNQGVTS